METGRSLLSRLLVPSDRLDVSPAGMLRIGGHEAGSLLRDFGSPLVVVAEETLRANYRRIRDAFVANWPAAVNVMYATKANSTLAIRALLSDEGAGGDCFGLGELHATTTGGTNPARVVMNGSNKGREEIAEAIRLGITINVDGDDEIDMAGEIAAATGREARLNLRLKLMPEGLDGFSAAFFKTGGTIREAVRRQKWGFTPEAASGLVRRILARPGLRLRGYSVHLGRFSADPAASAVVAAALGEAACRLHRETGAWPAMLDIGGGWPRQREPESRAPELNAFAIEEHAAAACGALRAALAPAGQALPELWLEPGRYIVGNASVLLATVGAVKRDAGLAWAHVDASTNDLMRIETSQSWYHLLPASRMDDPLDAELDLVGGTCIPSVIGARRAMPVLRRGDVVAILDAGMYAEAISNQFNSIPRPASVLVGPAGAEAIRRRETIADVFATHSIPERLRRAAGMRARA